jgi:GNAT superfamily N-acetyltransferase
MSSTFLRPATPRDIAAVVDVFQRSRAAAMPWLPVLHSHDEDLAFFGAQVEAQQASVMVVDGAVEAFAITDAGWLRQLFVAPDRHGLGLGTCLVHEAQRQYPDGLQLWAFEHNIAARAFYAARGFVEVEATDGAGNEERLPDVRMEWRPSAADLAADGV